MIRGVLEANEVELPRPVLRLAVDGAGAWNWQSFGDVLAKSAYLPGKVALTSVKIVDGALAVHGPDGAERTRFEGFNGELSAPALDGPYRAARHLRQGRRPARAEDRHVAAGSRRHGALQGDPAGRRGRLDVHSGRPFRRPHEQAARRG